MSGKKKKSIYQAADDCVTKRSVTITSKQLLKFIKKHEKESILPHDNKGKEPKPTVEGNNQSKTTGVI